MNAREAQIAAEIQAREVESRENMRTVNGQCENVGAAQVELEEQRRRVEE